MKDAYRHMSLFMKTIFITIFRRIAFLSRIVDYMFCHLCSVLSNSYKGTKSYQFVCCYSEIVKQNRSALCSRLYQPARPSGSLREIRSTSWEDQLNLSVIVWEDDAWSEDTVMNQVTKMRSTADSHFNFQQWRHSNAIKTFSTVPSGREQMFNATQHN